MKPQPPTPLQAFTFGYWGWGSATAELVRMVDASEAARGFAPPVFVDVRISRNVRAQGFLGGAFGDTVGRDRYVWMPDLGNQNILDGARGHTAPRIARPAAAADLLDVIEGAAAHTRRVLFFCACPIPAECHRTPVAALLVDAARARGTALTVTEWPGALATEPTLVVDEAGRRAAFSRGKARIPLGPTPDLATLGRIGWGTVVELRWAGKTPGRAFVAAGSPGFARGQWHLEQLTEVALATRAEIEADEAELRAMRAERGLATIGSG